METQTEDIKSQIELIQIKEATKGYAILCPDRLSAAGRDNLAAYWYSKMPKDIPMVVLDGGMQLVELDFPRQ